MKSPILKATLVQEAFSMEEKHDVIVSVKGGFELSFYGGLKMYDSGGLRIDRCQTV